MFCSVFTIGLLGGVFWAIIQVERVKWSWKDIWQETKQKEFVTTSDDWFWCLKVCFEEEKKKRKKIKHNREDSSKNEERAC